MSCAIAAWIVRLFCGSGRHQNVHRSLANNQLVGSVPESLYTLSELKLLYAITTFAVAGCLCPHAGVHVRIRAFHFNTGI